MCSDVQSKVGTLHIKMCLDVHTRAGTPHIKICSGVQNRVGTPHMKMCSDVQNRVGTPHIKMCLHVHNRVGTPHRPIGVFDQMFKLGWGHRTRSKMFETTNTIGWVVGGWVVTIRIIMPLRGSILQVGTCQILSLAENPRWS